jgi:hypothetical protein
MALASATAEDNALTGLITDAAYLGINTATPGTTGASECSGGSYARVAITWGTASAGSIANITSALTVNIPSGDTVDYFSTWGASSGTGSGGYQIGGALSASIDFTTAGTLTIAVGGLTLTAS